MVRQSIADLFGLKITFFQTTRTATFTQLLLSSKYKIYISHHLIQTNFIQVRLIIKNYLLSLKNEKGMCIIFLVSYLDNKQHNFIFCKYDANCFLLSSFFLSVTVHLGLFFSLLLFFTANNNEIKFSLVFSFFLSVLQANSKFVVITKKEIWPRCSNYF